MERRSHRRKHGQRGQQESAFSRHKRLFGPALRDRSDPSRERECYLWRKSLSSHAGLAEREAVSPALPGFSCVVLPPKAGATNHDKSTVYDVLVQAKNGWVTLREADSSPKAWGRIGPKSSGTLAI